MAVEAPENNFADSCNFIPQPASKYTANTCSIVRKDLMKLQPTTCFATPTAASANQPQAQGTHAFEMGDFGG
jgi:hypothetical protein